MNIKSDNSLSKKIVSGMIWRLLERGGMQIMQFVIQIVLARLLSPNDYGLLAIITVFISFSTTLINNGLGNAIIQRQDATEVEFNTVFYIQLGIATVCYIAIFLSAPFIAQYYGNDNLIVYLRVMSIILFIEALSSMQLTALRKRMEFKKSFFANVTGVFIQGVSGITFALLGLGIWSLILSQILMKIAILLVLLIMVKWTPRALFSFDSFKGLFSYSWKLTVAWMIGTLHQQIYSLVIGKCFSTEVLGYYNRGQNLPQTMTTTVNETISSVMFTALSKLQDNKQEFKNYTRLMMKLTAFAICPIMAGIAGVSENFVYVILTEKWAPSILMMQLFCISFGINILSTSNMQAFNAIGRSDVFMKLEIVKRGLSLVLLIIAAQFNIYLVIIVLAAMGVFSLIYNSFPNRKLLGYTIKEQLVDVVPSLVISLIMYGAVIMVNILPAPRIILLVVQVFVGAVVYMTLSFVFNKEGTREILIVINKLRGKA